MTQGFTIAAKASCSRVQIEDRLSRGFEELEIITFTQEFEKSLDEPFKVLSDYKGTVKYVSVHVPSDLTIAHVDAVQRRNAERCIEAVIEKAPEIGCERVVFHGFYHVTEISNLGIVATRRKQALQNCIDSIKRLDRTARDSGVKICMENINVRVNLDRLYYLIFSASPHDLLALTNEVRSEFFGFCFDAAHARNFCNFICDFEEMQAVFGIRELSIEKFLRIVSDNTDIIHLSDARGSIAGLKKTEHLPLGDGEIDFERLLEEILKIGFEGPIVLETREEDANNAIHMSQGREYLISLLNSISRGNEAGKRN